MLISKRTLIVLLGTLFLASTLHAFPKSAYLGMSLLLPGSGELALGKQKTGAVMLTADIIALSTYFHLDGRIKDLGQSYKEYAHTYADADMHQNDQFYLDLQSYTSSEEYNDYYVMIARNYFLIEHYDPIGFNDYVSSHIYGDDLSWEWKTGENWKEYKKIRTQYQKARLNKNLALGAMLLNRMISLIDVAFTRGKPHNVEIHVSPTGNTGLMLNYSYHF